MYKYNEESNTLDIYIMSDICADAWQYQVSAAEVVKAIGEFKPENIKVVINSPGGDVAEGLAIYNALKDSGAHITTQCTGFACSIASIVFLAGEERIMCSGSLLMIHNPWGVTAGNSNELKKTAETLDTISNQLVKIYEEHSNFSEDEIRTMLDDETWIDAEGAIECGFATSESDTGNTSMAAAWLKKIHAKTYKHDEEEKPEEEEPEEDPDEKSKDEAHKNKVLSMFSSFVKND